jgi:hypothetical protein
MSWTVKLLVVANRTADSDELFEALTARAQRDRIEVTLVVPASRSSASRDRLERAVRRLRDAGITVEGIAGAPDPLVAVSEIWDPRRFDEVIVVTLPTGTSRWLLFDLPHRVERLTGARVTHVVAGGSRRRMATAR